MLSFLDGLLNAFVAKTPIWIRLTFLLVTAVVYISKEGSFIHHRREYERIFWMAFFGAMTAAFLYAPDSPVLAQFPSLRQWALPLTMVSGWIARVFHKSFTKRGLKHIMSTSVTLAEKWPSTSARDKIYRLRALVKSIDWNMSEKRLFKRTFVLKVETEIIALFRSATTEELNYVVRTADLPRIISLVKNHDHDRLLFWPAMCSFSVAWVLNSQGPTAFVDAVIFVLSGVLGWGLAVLFWQRLDETSRKNQRKRQQLLRLLTQTRLHELSPLARASLVNALVKNGLQSWDGAEDAVRDCITTMSPSGLTAFKNAIDASGEYHNMVKLVYIDITSAAIRTQILDALWSHGSKSDHRRLSALAGVRILSDIDDTFFSSGGDGIAGIDARYPHHVLYPGVSAFYREIDRAANGASSRKGSNLAFLSARPHAYGDLTERQVYNKFQLFAETGRLHVMPTLLPGPIANVGGLTVSGRKIVMSKFEGVALRKFKSFSNYARIFPEYDHIFVGDNGQGDVRAAEMMLTSQEFAPRLRLVFINLVQPVEFTHGHRPGLDEDGLTCEQRWHRLGIRFFRTYVGAAVHAFRAHLLSTEGLVSVCRAAVNDFKHLAVTCSLGSVDCEASRHRELQLDLADAARLVPPPLFVPELPRLAPTAS